MLPKPFQNQIREKSPQLREATGNISLAGSSPAILDTTGAGTTTFQRHRSAPCPPADLKLGPDYEVLELIGQGGMGYVYKVKDKRKNQLVAIKLVRPELAADPRALKRFTQEAEAAMGLLHPNLVPVYAQGVTEGGAPYLVMEYQEGTSLDRILAQEESLEVTRVVDICQQICHALEHAHHKGLVHRDLKPSNIVLCDGDNGALPGRDLVRIVDFGIAKVLAGPESRETFDLTHTGDLFGSPSYMSPEQCMGYKLDARSDIYSLGCVMYELLSGHTPFDSDNPVQTIVKHLSDTPAPLKQTALGQAIPASLEAIVMRCLAKAPEDRYGSMQQLRQDLSNDKLSERNTFTKPAKHHKKQLPLAVKIVAVSLVNFAALNMALTQEPTAVQSAANAQSLIATCEHLRQDVDLAAAMISEYRNTGNDAFGGQFSRQWEGVFRDYEHLASSIPNGSAHERQRQLAGKQISECQTALIREKAWMDQIKWPKLEQPMTAAAMAEIKAKQTSLQPSAAPGDPAAQNQELELQQPRTLLKAEADYRSSYFKLEEILEQIEQQEQKVLYAEPATTSKNIWLALLTVLNIIGLIFVVGGNRGWVNPPKDASKKGRRDY
jgi:serine/threonine protein kinase